MPESQGSQRDALARAEAPSLFEQLRAESRRGLVVAAGVLLLLMIFVLWPERVETVSATGEARVNQCGLTYYLFGVDFPEVERACRDAFAGRAVGFFLVLVGLVVVAGALVWQVLAERGSIASGPWADERNRRMWTQAILGLAGVLGVVAGVLAAIAGADGIVTEQITPRQ